MQPNETMNLTISPTANYPVSLADQAVAADGTPARQGGSAYVAEFSRPPQAGDSITFREQWSDKTLHGYVTAVESPVTGGLLRRLSSDPPPQKKSIIPTKTKRPQGRREKNSPEESNLIPI